MAVSSVDQQYRLGHAQLGNAIQVARANVERMARAGEEGEGGAGGGAGQWGE